MRVIDKMVAEVIERVKKIPKKYWYKMYRAFNAGYWPKILHEKPEWWDSMISDRVATYFELVFPGKKVFDYEVIGEVVKFMEKNIMESQIR